MNEFIDKLIAKLEKESQVVTTPIAEIECLKLSDAIDAVKRVAEEYGDGWIPCNERIPEDADEYLVTQYNEEAIDEYCNGYRVSKIFFDDNGWWDDIDAEFGWEIIAWQPLPKAYQPKGE